MSSAKSFCDKRSTSSFQARRQGHRPRGVTQVHPLQWWWYTYTSFTSVDAAPNPPPAGKPTPPPSPPLAGNPTPPPSPPPAKKQKEEVKEGSKVTHSWIINPKPYVPKTTRVPTPSLKPLLPRPWEVSVEENEAAVAAHYEKWKAEVKEKKRA